MPLGASPLRCPGSCGFRGGTRELLAHLGEDIYEALARVARLGPQPIHGCMGCLSERGAQRASRARASGAAAAADGNAGAGAGAGAGGAEARRQWLIDTVAQSTAKIALLRATLAREQRRLQDARAELAGSSLK